MTIVARTPGTSLGGRDVLVTAFERHGFPPPHPITAAFPRLPNNTQEELRNSVRAVGVIRPIIVFENMIADGIERCAIAIKENITWATLRKEEFKGDEQALLQFLLARQHLGESERAMVAARLAKLKRGRPNAQICAITQTRLAHMLNVSLRSISTAHGIIDRGVPALQDAVDQGILTVSAAHKLIRLPVEQQNEIIRKSLAAGDPVRVLKAAVRNSEIKAQHREIIDNARQHDLRGKRYQIVVVDIPWEGLISSTGDPYPRLSIDEIREFQLDGGRLLRDVIADNAIVYVWILDRHLLELSSILEAIGDLNYCYMMPWPKKGGGFGRTTDFQHELCLVCTRGNLPPPERRSTTLIVDPPLPSDCDEVFRYARPHDQRNSSKPDRLQEKIEHDYPQYFGPDAVERPLALEIFARNYRAGWDGFGYEYPGRPAKNQAIATKSGSDVELIDSSDEKSTLDQSGPIPYSEE